MYYALNEFKVPYPVSFQEFLEIYKRDGRTRVARDEFESEGVEILVSTVFLGLDHGFAGLGYPILFETMIFGGANDQYLERYRTWDEALEGHKKAVDIAQSKEVKGVVNE